LGQVYHNKEGGFAFVNMDYRASAEKAVRELSSKQLRGRNLKIRFAAITTGISVKNLTPTVTNELLYKAFSVFGIIELCRVNVDERGKSIGSGVIIFTEKRSAVMAFKRCNEESFFLTSTLRPVIVEPWETRDDEEGCCETSIPKNELFRKERREGPRFAETNSYESEYGKRWKQLFEIYKEKKVALENDLKAEMEALEVKMQLVIHQHETEKLRKELAMREQEALELQMGLGQYGSDQVRPTQLTSDVYETAGDTGYGSRYAGAAKRPHNYYDEPRNEYEAPTKRQQTQSNYDYYRSGARQQEGKQHERSYANVVSGQSGTAYDNEETAYGEENTPTDIQQALGQVLEDYQEEEAEAADPYSNFKQKQPATTSTYKRGGRY